MKQAFSFIIVFWGITAAAIAQSGNASTNVPQLKQQSVEPAPNGQVSPTLPPPQLAPSEKSENTNNTNGSTLPPPVLAPVGNEQTSKKPK